MLAACCWLLCVLVPHCLAFHSWKGDHRKGYYGSYAPVLSSISPETRMGETKIFRELGGYERLLSRITPNSNKVSLSHGTVFIFDGYVTHSILLRAVEHCANRHPMLRAYIFRDSENKKEYWSDCKFSSSEVARRVLSTIEIPAEQFENVWKVEMEKSLNDALFPEEGPLWMMKNFISDSDEKKSAWSFSFNHGSDDQQSVNIVVKDLLEYIYSYSRTEYLSTPSKTIPEVSSLPFPKCVEDAIAPDFLSMDTLKWGLFQLSNQVKNADMLPASIIENYRSNPERYLEEYANPDMRSTFLEYLILTKDEIKSLRLACRAHGVTISNVLSAAILSLTSSLFQENDKGMPMKSKKLRFLLSVGLRPFGISNPNEEIQSVLGTSLVNSDKKENSYMGRRSTLQSGSNDWTLGTVACASGAVDFVVSVPGSIAAQAKEMSQHNHGTKSFDGNIANDVLWKLAEECRDKAKDIIDVNKYVPESVRLFGFGMKYADILKIVDMEANNPGTMGRGYSCGVSNVGLVVLPGPPPDSDVSIRINSAYYGTSHARNGVYCLLSSITIGETFCGCLQFTRPFVSKEEAKCFRDGLLAILRSLN